MDTTVMAIAEEAAKAMRSNGYMESSIAQNMKGFRYLSDHCGYQPYTPTLGKDWIEAPKPGGGAYCENYVGFKRKIVHLCDSYIAEGKVDLSVISSVPPQPIPKSPLLQKVLAAYGVHNKERGLALGTCNYYERLAREYALFLEEIGITDIDNADAASVLGFMVAISAKWTRTSTYHLATNFRPFLKWLERDDLIDAIAMSNPKREHRIAPILADEDEEAIALVCCNGSVPARDAAITLLALTTGMRACDIIGLQVTSIDWRSSTITTVQQKTGNPITVPMHEGLAEALGKYLLEERPESCFGNVFVRQKAPHAPYTDHSAIYEATKRTLAAAEVTGGGTRLLRHNAASKMLRAGVALPVISSVLGHADPDSTNVYMEADEGSMAACVLPLPRGCAR